ncbi:MAG: hypothetical protein ACLUTH_10375 [Blautia massiliensis (ex Durand et al. 2017)]
MADQNITALPVATLPASSDQLLLVGATEEKLIDYDKLADAILTKLTSKQYTLDQGTKTLPAALNELNSNRLSSYASAASDKIPDGNEIAFLRAGENAIVVNENLTIPPWAFCIYIPFGRDAGLIVVGIGKVIAAYRMNSTWTYRYDIK